MSKADLDDQYAKLQDEQDALELLKTETEKKKQQVADQQAATGSKLSEYEKLLAQKEGEITDMAEFIKEKTDLLNQLIAKAAQEEAAARIRAAQQAAASMNTSGNIQQADSGISGGSVSLSDYEIMMLATIIYCEAGSESYVGKVAVGNVIMNRVKSASQPNTITEVVYAKGQFSPVRNGSLQRALSSDKADAACYQAAIEALAGAQPVGGKLFFRRNNGRSGQVIGHHVFY